MTALIDALLFGPGLPATGLCGKLRAAPDHVEISWSAPAAAGETMADEFAGEAVSVALDEVAFAPVGFGKPGLELRWNATADQGATAAACWLAHVLDPAAATALRTRADWAHLPALRSLNHQSRRQRLARVVGWSAIALLVLSPLLLALLLFTQAGRIAEAIAERIPLEQERQLGRQAFESMRGELRLLAGSTAERAVADIGSRLTRGSRYTYEFHVADDATLNAFALPGGIIVVHSGLIAATRRPEELAGVLAHEVQHVELRHGTAGLVRELGWRALWTFVTGDWGGTLAGQAAAELGSLKFSRDAEAAADAAGFDALVAADIDPTGMADFFATMTRQSPAAPPAFLSTHPASDDREARLRARVTALAGRRFAPLDTGGWPP